MSVVGIRGVLSGPAEGSMVSVEGMFVSVTPLSASTEGISVNVWEPSGTVEASAAIGATQGKQTVASKSPG